MFGNSLERHTRWLSSPVQSYSGSPAEISRLIPQFERSDFSGNAYLDVIKRKPMNDAEGSIAVGVVSKQYQFVQHKDIFVKVVRVMEKADMALSETP